MSGGWTAGAGSSSGRWPAATSSTTPPGIGGSPGDGEFSAIVAERIGGRVVAHDWAAAECRATQAAGLSAVRGDARRLPFADRIADVTVAFEIVEHFSKSAGLSVIDELHRVTKPNGTLLLSTPNRYALESFKGLARYFRDGTIWNARDETHVKLYSRRELISALRPRFDVVRSYGYYLFEAGRLPIPGSHTITANALLANLCFILIVVATPKPDCADHRTAQVAVESLRVRPEAVGVAEVVDHPRAGSRPAEPVSGGMIGVSMRDSGESDGLSMLPARQSSVGARR